MWTLSRHCTENRTKFCCLRNAMEPRLPACFCKHVCKEPDVTRTWVLYGSTCTSPFKGRQSARQDWGLTRITWQTLQGQDSSPTILARTTAATTITSNHYPMVVINSLSRIPAVSNSVCFSWQGPEPFMQDWHKTVLRCETQWRRRRLSCMKIWSCYATPDKTNAVVVQKRLDSHTKHLPAYLKEESNVFRKPSNPFLGNLDISNKSFGSPKCVMHL